MTDYGERYDKIQQKEFFKYIEFGERFEKINKCLFRNEVSKNVFEELKKYFENEIADEFKNQDREKYDLVMSDYNACIGALGLIEKRLEDMRELLLTDEDRDWQRFHRQEYIRQMEKQEEDENKK